MAEEDLPSLEEIVRGSGALSIAQLRLLRRWVDADWEAADFDRDAVRAIRRLLDTIKRGTR